MQQDRQQQQQQQSAQLYDYAYPSYDFNKLSSDSGIQRQPAMQQGMQQQQ
jgi:hypothetical protein